MTNGTFLLALILSASPERVIDFDTDVIPIFTNAGCNVGACHGSAVGRGGFKLSLYGSDQDVDYYGVVHQHEGRRVNLAEPDASLIIQKPTESLEHGGGYRLQYEGPDAMLLQTWIAQGAQRHRLRKLVDFEVQPSSFVAARPGEQIQLRSFARFDDGTEKEVTRWTVFKAEDDNAVQIDATSASTMLVRRGRHVVVARYLDRVVPMELIVPLADVPIDFANAPRHNFIDEYINQTLETLRIPLSGQAGDSAFLRRIWLDLTGRLPPPDQVREQLADDKPIQRELVIDRLLESEAFVEYWTYKFGKLLRIKPNGLGENRDSKGADTYYRWLRQQISDAVPYDRMARTLLTASGDSHEIGPANFYRTVSGAREQAEFTSELFMASRLRCANCHNHPLDRWTQDDYHGFAAVFAKLEQGRVIQLGRRGEVIHPRTGEAAVARIPGESFLESDIDGRQLFADWLTSSGNPYFAKATVNRLWRSMMGRGLVEPTDDMRQTNLASHPALLEQLTDDFITSGYDLRHTLKSIASSAAYQRDAGTVAGNEGDNQYYSHSLVRPLEAEVLSDALSDVTGVWETYGNRPDGTRAILLYDPAIESKSLDVLGRCLRDASCEVPAGAAAGGLSRKLHMVNGALVNQKITSNESRLKMLISTNQPDDQILNEFYLRCLTRLPSNAEREIWNDDLDNAANEDERRQVLEDLLWSLLSCREFVTNH